MAIKSHFIPRVVEISDLNRKIFLTSQVSMSFFIAITEYTLNQSSVSIRKDDRYQ